MAYKSRAPKTAREVAVQALLQVNGKGGYSNLVLDSLLRTAALPPEERSFASILLYGTLERQLTLDGVIRHYSSKPLSALTPAVREILRVSLYQLLYLDSVPDSAAVNQGVALTRTLRVASAAGFVNALLRSFVRDGKRLPPFKGSHLQQLEYRYSCPSWLIGQLLEAYGEQDTTAFLESSLGRPNLYARVNRARITANALQERLAEQGVLAQPDPWLPDCLLLGATRGVEELAAFREGLFYIQDKSSQLCAAAVGARPGERVLDLCAAPGSKSFTMAQGMEGQGRLVSCDILPGKVERIRQSAARLGFSLVEPVVNDAAQYRPEFSRGFDRVLCDVPCSGMGILGRKPEIKYKDPASLEELPALQAAILETASRYLRPGGRLVYSTCTLLPRENGQVVDAFLQSHPEFAPDPMDPWLAGRLALPQGGWRVTLLPHLAQTDGFFFAVMKKVR